MANPPIALIASWKNDGVMEVTFDKALQETPLAQNNWVLTLSGGGIQGPSAAVVQPPDQVTLTFPATVPATNIQYAASPADVIGTNGASVLPLVIGVS